MDRERLMSSDEQDYQYDPIRHGTPWRDRIKKLLGPAIGLILLLGKWGIVLLKFSSIFIAFGGYALIFGWKFALGFVLLILLHESGHFLEAKREGLHPRLPVFIPFLGAYVQYARGNPWQTVRVAIARPILCGAPPAPCLAFADHSSDSPDLFSALAYTA